MCSIVFTDLSMAFINFSMVFIDFSLVFHGSPWSSFMFKGCSWFLCWVFVDVPRFLLMFPLFIHFALVFIIVAMFLVEFHAFSGFAHLWEDEAMLYIAVHHPSRMQVEDFKVAMGFEGVSPVCNMSKFPHSQLVGPVTVVGWNLRLS